MVVRSMTPSDSKEVAALSDQLGYPSTTAEIEKRVGTLSYATDSSAFVAEKVDGRISGWIHIFGVRFLQEEPFAEVSGLVVDANSRGQGVGRSLLQAAERWARENGFGGIYIRVNTKRLEAPVFYEKLGYNQVKTQRVFHKGV